VLHNSIASFVRELNFALRDRVVVVTLVVAALLSTFTLVSGLQEVSAERALIKRVESLVTQDRNFSLASQSDAGGAAYYAFHFTYDPPSSLAFVSRGVRDDLPWKHRLRLLALEGQIYETDVGNPQLSQFGKLDFSFVVAFLLPLLSILVLYDLRAVEMRNNRWAFVSATSGDGNKLLRNRAALRSTLLCLCAIVPFVIYAAINSASLLGILIVIGAVILNLAVWFFIALIISSRVESGPTAAALLLGAWFTIAIAVPVGGKLLVEKSISVPKGGEILLTQREAVNGAWDLPKEATMKPFIEKHPEWADAVEVNRPFEWKWFFAFQQIGDQIVEPHSQDLRSGIAKRDNAMSIVSIASPSLLTARLLSRAANTNIAAFQRYDTCVREFHASLREFHYPMLFGRTEYSAEHMVNLPSYQPCPYPI